MESIDFIIDIAPPRAAQPATPRASATRVPCHPVASATRVPCHPVSRSFRVTFTSITQFSQGHFVHARPTFLLQLEQCFIVHAEVPHAWLGSSVRRTSMNWYYVSALAVEAPSR